MSRWAYEMSNEELIGEFSQACAYSGMAGSGLVIDPAGPLHAAEARYLRGVLLARLEKKKPPFKRGDVVRNKTSRDIYSVDWWGSVLPPDSRKTIQRIHYDGNNQWSLEFKAIPPGKKGYPRFNANEFVLESSVAAVGK